MGWLSGTESESESRSVLSDSLRPVHGILQARLLEWVAFSACSSGARGRHRFDSWIREIPWRRAMQPTLVSLPGESHGQRSLVGCSPQGGKESDTSEQLALHFKANHFQFANNLFTLSTLAFFSVLISFSQTDKMNDRKFTTEYSTGSTIHYISRVTIQRAL